MIARLQPCMAELSSVHRCGQGRTRSFEGPVEEPSRTSVPKLPSKSVLLGLQPRRRAWITIASRQLRLAVDRGWPNAPVDRGGVEAAADVVGARAASAWGAGEAVPSVNLLAMGSVPRPANANRQDPCLLEQAQTAATAPALLKGLDRPWVSIPSQCPLGA